MARLHEYQGKSLLQKQGIAIPRGRHAGSVEEALNIFDELGCPVVIKGQAWVTKRADRGLIRFAGDVNEVRDAAKEILGEVVEGFTIDTLLVEEQISIEQEFYAGIVIDDRIQSPLLIFSARGGTGIEEIAREYPESVIQSPIDIEEGLPDYRARNLVRQVGITGRTQLQLGLLLSQLYAMASGMDARAAEINPISLTADGKLVAADCRVTIDDYAVYRHPELGIEVAREFNRPPTALEKIAWEIEKHDYRGTFYFVQMEQDFQHGDGVVGFHGAGGGGSMMSMDALLKHGYKLANFVDTSGNPPASKVYRAARIILAQGPIDGYFASGSGVASQEQFHSARGLAKAFMESPLEVPAVLRLGGNAEEQALSILEKAQAYIPATIEAYGKDDSPEFCAARLDALIKSKNVNANPAELVYPEPGSPYTFQTVTGGTITFDHAICKDCETKICVEKCVPGILSLADEVPVLQIEADAAAKGGCVECLACQVECVFEGLRGCRITLPIEGLDADLATRSAMTR
jgi:succinyl-CoA synthetase beta subunit